MNKKAIPLLVLSLVFVLIAVFFLAFATGFCLASLNAFLNADDVGDVAVIETTVPGDATGWVHVTVDGKTYGALVDGGKASIEVSGLSNGTHEIVVSYEGDDKYLPNNNV